MLIEFYDEVDPQEPSSEQKAQLLKCVEQQAHEALYKYFSKRLRDMNKSGMLFTPQCEGMLNEYKQCFSTVYMPEILKLAKSATEGQYQDLVRAFFNRTNTQRALTLTLPVLLEGLMCQMPAIEESHDLAE